MSVILTNISKSFNGQQVLNNFSYGFKNGEKYCIMGRSGCGKTTLINIILGLLKQDSGTVVCADTFACVFQEDRLIGDLSAKKNISLVFEGDVSAFANKLFLSDEDITKPVKELSGGQKRRVALLRAVLAKSDVLVLDEAGKGLDDETKTATFEFVRENLNGRTLICITHSGEDATFFGAKTIFL